MRYLVALLLLFSFSHVAPVQADWRWHTPKIKVHRVKARCDSYQCYKKARLATKFKRQYKVALYDLRKEREWHHWIHLYIPTCTWYGESGTGPEYARSRYTMPNSGGSGAYGKFQFMPSTYFASGKYDDWSPLDQEIAARVEYWKHGTAPWSNC